MTQVVPKKINLRLAGRNDKAFSLAVRFHLQAREEGWSHAEIDAVLDEALSGDFEHLLATLANHCQDGDA